MDRIDASDGAVPAFDSCNERGAKLMIRFCDRLVKMRIIKIEFRVSDFIEINRQIPSKDG